MNTNLRKEKGNGEETFCCCLKKTKKTIRGVMGNSGEGKQFKPFDLSGNLTWKLFLKKFFLLQNFTAFAPEAQG